MTIAPSSLLKSYMHNSIAEGIYHEITNRTARYYYFLGKTLVWNNEDTPPFPIDSFNYEMQTRTEMITFKEIKPTDVAFVIPRHSWQLNTVYDMYDDQYSKEVQGYNLISGGIGYSTAPYVWVGSAGSVTWTANTVILQGAFIRVTNGNGGFRYYVAATGGTTGTTAPTHTEGSVTNGSVLFTHVVVTDGNGSGASAQAVILDGKVIDVILVERGINYTSAPSVHIAGGQGSGGIARAVVNIAPSGVQKLEDARFYVVTDEFNVYKCLDNNNNAQSLYKPIGTGVDPITFPDGYMWKFLYNIPIALRTKFLTNDYMPVVTALKNQFYSSGNLQAIRIDQAGSGYTTGTITVQGDGYLEQDPIYITAGTISNQGTGYSSATLTVTPPFSNVSAWLPSTLVIQGQKLSYNSNIYEVSVSGTTGTVGPIHRYDIVANGTSALKYVGTTITGTVTLTGSNVTAINLSGMIRDIQIISNGSGYTSAPVVNITGGSGTGSHAAAVLQNGSVIQVIVTNNGDGFTSAPTITFGTPWASQAEVSLSDQIFSSNRLYTVTSATPQLNISRASYTGKSVSVNARDTAPSGITFSADGTKMFVLGDTGNNVVVYNLSTAWDVSTAGFSYESGALQTETAPTGIAFSSDGLKMYVVGTVGDSVQEYTLATPWTISTSALTAAASFSILSQDTTSGGLAFSSTGNKMWVVGSTGDAVYEYTLSTPWSVSTASFTTSFNVATQTTSAGDICFSADGKYMLVVDSSTDIIYQYTLGTANSIATALYTTSFFVGGSEATPTGIFLHPSNQFFYVVGTNGDTVYQFQNLLLSKLGTVAPSHISGTAVNGDVILTYVGSPATATASLKYGAGYSAVPTATIVGNTGSSGATVTFSSVKSEAKLIPIFDAGQLVDVQIDDGGIGYSYVNLTVNGNGSGAEISALLSPGDINSLQANIELLTIDGRIMSIPIVSGGWGYAAATVTIEGDGTGATATAVIENGTIKKINMVAYGQNYRWARAVISGNGYGAKARPVITPFGGHGKYAINGLFARTLMFYTNISGDKNQGFVVNNDYRQLGIVKNPRQYNSTTNAVAISGSACFVISGNISTTFFPADSIIRESVTSRRFRVVTNTGSAALVQSLDNFVPQIGTTFVNDGNFTFVANAVTLPTIDKYSGDLLFIDNRQGFTPTIDQSVTLRTILRF